MSELQEHQFCECDEIVREYRGPLSNEMRPYYLKYEADKVIAHNKYKRCLAMARLCHERSLWWYSNGYGFEKYDKLWEKWEKRWLGLAEKFKEAK